MNTRVVFIHTCVSCYSLGEWLIQEYSQTGGIRLSAEDIIHKSEVWCHCTLFHNKMQYKALWPVPIALTAYRKICNTIPQDSGLLKQKHPTFFSSNHTTEIQIYIGTDKPAV